MFMNIYSQQHKIHNKKITRHENKQKNTTYKENKNQFRNASNNSISWHGQ